MSLLGVMALRKGFRAPDGDWHEVVDIPTFGLAPQQQVAISGESGSGKTTFLHLIAGILMPDAGQITVDGQPMAGLREAERDRQRALRVGYIFQTFNLLQGYTCLENVLLAMAFGRGADRQAATTLLRRVGLGHRLHHYPRQLSSGQQQRVAVARALANHPRLVLADEPTGQLDRRSSSEALTLLRESCREQAAALLLVSHDREVLAGFGTVMEFAQINQAATPSAPASDEPRPSVSSP